MTVTEWVEGEMPATSADSLSNTEINALQAILTEKPVRNWRDFVVSTAFEQRQSIDRFDRLSSRTIPHDVLPGWAEPAHQLGPYERYMLSSILSAHESLVIFRSGTGSGKSSLLEFVSSYLNNTNVRQQLCPESDIHVKHLLSVIDLEAIPEKFVRALDTRENVKNTITL